LLRAGSGNVMQVDCPPFQIHSFDTLDSTNTVLKKWVDAPEFTCVTADEQTAGRGRRDRTWHSAPGDGLYLSILLRPPSASNLSLIGLLAAIAVAETLIARGVEGVDIKWPNDVLVNERKLCGILAEGASGASGDVRIILGIGVNLNHAAFPDELRERATSLFLETGQRNVVAVFRDRLLESLAFWYDAWRRGEPARITERWQTLSSYARGQRVVVTLDGGQVCGVTEGLAAHGALRLRTDDGELHLILAGEVARLRKDC
jgi:BirA family transcriptional regulator, biotin operon repressor / biotin---[acetyl-CoA-carboxylase] ligase